MSSFWRLFRSRKVLVLLLDTIIGLGLYFCGKYWPAGLGDVNFVIVALQPVFLAVIGAIAWADAAFKRNGHALSIDFQAVSPILALFGDGKFLLLLLDVSVSLLLYFGAKHLAGGLFEDIKFVVGLMQPVFVMIIVAMTKEEMAEMEMLPRHGRW